MSDSSNSAIDEVALTPQEQADVRARIEEVAAESRIPVTPEAFSLKDVRRGIVLPLAVAGIVLLVVVVSLVILFSVFRRGESMTRAQAGEYVSIEGRLIRELRQESQEELGAKDQEIAQIRARLGELEEEQIALEESIDARIAQREDELRQQLQADIEAERERLVRTGVGSEELARLLATFEAERRAFYERQLEEYRAELEAERRTIQANIDRLRSEYESRLNELQSERDQILREFARREAQLRAQLQQRTSVAAGADEAELEAAGEELSRLAREADEERAVAAQIVGQIERIREAILAGNNPRALELITSLRDYLSEERVVAVESVAARRESDLFLLGQLEQLVESRIEEESEGATEGSLIRELDLLRRLREMASDSGADLTDEDRAALLVEFLTTFSEVGITPDQLDAALAARATGQGEQETVADDATGAEDRSESGADEAAELLARLSQEESTREELQAAVDRFTAALRDAERRERGLESEVEELSAFEAQVAAAQARYQAYLDAVESARSGGLQDANTAARQELDEFLSSQAVRTLFSDLDREVQGLFSATQTAGSTAALDDAADIVSAIMGQPTTQASLAMIAFEKEDAEDNPELLTILEALEQALQQ
ncbi:MAG: hypothetical protein ACOCW6_06335 [Spirochaetota bacterium]